MRYDISSVFLPRTYMMMELGSVNRTAATSPARNPFL